MEKIVIYQTLPRLFGNRDVPMRKDGSIAENGSGKFADYTPAVLDAIRELGATHIWYTGILSHATTTDYASYGLPHDHPAVVKGKAGSPYAIRDYYDLDPDLAVNVGERMAEFQALVERSHRAGMKVIIDFVANHVARQYHSTAKPSYVEDLGQGDDTSMAFSSQNNFYYIPNQPLILQFATPDTDFPYSEFPAKATGNDHFDAYPHKDDWYETVKLNYGIDYRDGHKACLTPRPNTWDKMLDILSFWADKGVDGFRCDMAGMVPVAFWAWAIPQLKSRHQLLFIAELYEPATYRAYLKAGFDCLYDKVGLYDTLREVVCGRAPASRITSAWQQVDGIQGQMLAFLENHDEQRIASDFFAGNARAGLPGLWVAALINTNPVMIYNGQELGERGMDAEGFSGMDGRTSIFDYWSMASVRQWLTGQALKPEQNALRETYLRLLNMAAKEPVFTKGAFHDLMYANLSQPGFDPNKQYAFLRKWRDEAVLVAVNFDEQARDVRVQIPAQAFKALGIADNSPARTTDLQTGQTNMGTLTASWPYRLQLPPKGGRAIKFKFLQSLCLCLLTLCLLGSCRRGKAPDVTWAGLLKEMATPEKAAVWPDIPYRTYAKSGETKGLLFDQSGPGVITRLELADGAPKDGKLDFFFDKAEKPALSLDASDWTKMRPALPKAFLGPGTLLFPIPFNRQCRIVYEAPSGASPLRYQIDYRLYSRKRVETFSQDGLDDLKKQIARTAKQLTSPDSMAKPKSRIIQGNVTLRGGMPAVVTLPQGGMAVYELCVRLTPMEGSYQQAMRDLTLQGIFDGLITFRAPLAEFSGGGMGGYPVKTFYLEADGQGEVVSRWFMPYRETAELAFINEGVNQQHIRYSIRLVPIRWTPDLLYFHASWKEKLNVPLRKAPATALPWAFAVIRGGKGIYKGDVLSLYNHSNGWFGKGQMQIWVDQDPDLSPSEDCASLAAYYDLGSLPPKAGQNAFGGLVRYGLADSYGYNTLLRLRNLDNIPFRDSLRIGLRWLGQTSGQVDCSTTVFWYGDNKAQAAVTTRAETTARQLPPSPADETEQ